MICGTFKATTKTHSAYRSFCPLYLNICANCEIATILCTYTKDAIQEIEKASVNSKVNHKI